MKLTDTQERRKGFT